MQVKDLLDLVDLTFTVSYNDLGTMVITKGNLFNTRGWMLIDSAVKKKRYCYRIVDAKAFNAYLNLIPPLLPDKLKS